MEEPVMSNFFAKFYHKKSSVPTHNIFDDKECKNVVQYIEEESSINEVYEKKISLVDYEQLQETILGKVGDNFHRYL